MGRVQHDPLGVLVNRLLVYRGGQNTPRER